MLPLEKKEKNKFVLRLNKELYKKSVIDKAVSEEKDWISDLPSPRSGHFCLELKTSDIRKALEWSNYLLYLNKIS